METKDYVAIAEAIRLHFPVASGDEMQFKIDQWNIDRDAIADVLAAENPRFDRDRFERACCALEY